MAHAQIIGGKLAICYNESVQSIGIRSIRKSIKQIESSNLELKQSTKNALASYKEAVSLWDARR